MANSKVQLADGTVIIDISDTTATEDDVLPGKTLYKSDGTKVTGSLGTATESSNGLMSAEDKAKLDGIEEHATENRIVKSVGRSSVASFQDGADNLPMALTVDIEPVQDLHGYASPWPGGGGKNKLPSFDTGLWETCNTGSYNVSPLGGTVTFPFTIPAGGYNGVPGCKVNVSAGDYYISGVPGTYTIVSFFNSSGTRIGSVGREFTGGVFTVPAETAYLYVAISNYTGVSALTLTEDMFAGQLEVGSIGTEYAPYSNICPISGWTGANVTQTGKNLFDPNLTYESGYWGTDGSVVSSANYKMELEYIPVKGNTSYAFQMNKTASTSRVLSICEYDESKTFIEYTIIIPSTAATTGVVSGTILTKESTKYIRINVPVENVSNIQFEENTDATDYEPYAGEEYSIAFPSSAGTVYGGTLTVNKDGTGTLVVDRNNLTIYEVPSVTTSTGYKALTFNRSGMISADESRKPVSDFLPFINNNEASRPWTAKARSGNNRGFVLYFPKELSDEEIVEMTIGKNVCYYLREPSTYSLTAPQVRSLLGINHIWADTGDILSVEYQTTAASDIVNVMEPQLISLLNAIFPVGTIYTTTSGIAPTFGEGWTWQEIVVPLTWNDLKTGDRHAYSGTSAGGFHYWKRIA